MRSNAYCGNLLWQSNLTLQAPERREVLRTHIVETAKRIYGAPEFFYYALADGIQKLFTRFGKWSAKLDLKKVLLKPSPQLEFAFVDGDG